MPALALTRKRIVIVGAVVLVVCVATVVVLSRNTRASAGPLRHDDTLQTTAVEKTWHARIGHGGPCLTIGFRGEITGNARPTWGVTGPATVWEHLRVHNTHIRVEAYELSPDGTCGEPAEMRRLRYTLVRENEEGSRRIPNTGSSFNKTARGNSINRGFAGPLDGGAYDRGESYRPTLGVYVEPHWSINGGSASDGVTVEDTFELPVD